MNESFPPDVQEYLQQAIANGGHANEQEVVIAALRDVAQRHDALRRDIQSGIEELDRGEGEPLDMEVIKAEVAKNYTQENDAA